jgi:hypothetical protein
MPWGGQGGAAAAVAEQYGLELDELFSMADYCNLSDLYGTDTNDTSGSSTGTQLLLATAAQAATLPLEARWSMHVAQGGRM